MSSPSRVLAVLAVLAALAVCAAAAPQAGVAQEQQLQVTSIVTDRWPSVDVTVTVVDPAGRPVTGLAAANFHIRTPDEELPVTGVTTTSDPRVGIAVLLIFDVSGSMAGPPLDQAKAAGKALIEKLGPTDQAAILAFADQPVLVQAFTPDKAALNGAIDGLSNGVNTALYAAVQQGSEVARAAPLPRRAIVLLSDGLDYGVPVTTTREQSLDIVAASGTTFMAIGLGSNIDSQYLSDLAARGHGQFLLAPAPSDLEAVYRAAADVLRQQYVLTVDASSLALGSPPVLLRVEALVGDAVLAGEASLSVPPQVVPPATPVITPAPTVAPTPEAGRESSSSPLPFVLAGAAAVLAAGGVTLLIVRRRRRSPAVELEAARFRREPHAGDFPTIERAAQEDLSGAWLELPDGRRYPLGESPVTVGFTSDCVLNLTNGPEQRHERVRIWQRDGRYMLHNLSRLGDLTVSGRAVSWVVLEDGDTILLGPRRVVFHDPRPEPPAKI